MNNQSKNKQHNMLMSYMLIIMVLDRRLKIRDPLQPTVDHNVRYRFYTQIKSVNVF
jgi:hypothetical protein